MRKAHQKTEGQLNTIGHSLITTLGQTISDVNNLHEKIQRKEVLLAQNSDIWSKSQNQVNEITEQVEKEIGSFSVKHSQIAEAVSTRMSEFVGKEVNKLKNTYEAVQDSMEKFTKEEDELSLETMYSKDEMNELLESMKILRDEVKTRVGEGLRSLNDAAERISAEVLAELGLFHESVSFR